MDNNQFNNNHLPFNGDAKSFHANLPDADNISIGGAPLQGQMMQNQVMREPVTQTQTVQRTPKKKHTGLIIAVLAVIVLVAGGVSSYFLFLTPEKRFERAMNKAEEAYEDGNYKSAAGYYGKALRIHDDDLDAMYGKLISNHEMGDSEELEEDYNTFTSQISAMEDSVLEDKKKEIAEIFLLSRDIFGGDEDKILEELEKGLSLTEDASLLEAWTSIKLGQALVLEADDKEAAIAIYASILDRADGNEEATEHMTTLLKEVLDDYISIYAYEQAQELVDTYRDTLSTINFTDYEARIGEAKVIAEQGIPLLQKVAKTMAAGDYETMCEIDCGDETALFAPYVNECFIYAEDGFTEDYTGTAVGIYKNSSAGFGEMTYYYYGEYVNGERSGQGVAFCTTDLDTHTYELYDGAWANDFPNGYGISGSYNEVHDDEKINELIAGNYVDGYAHGEMEASITSDAGYTVTGTFTADNGKVEDVRDQYPDYDFGVGEDRVIYVVMENEEHVWWISKSQVSRIDAGYWIEKKGDE